ncbi:MAG: GTP cyclohydrolase MptA, partial [Solirubrobacterales bacterium]
SHTPSANLFRMAISQTTRDVQASRPATQVSLTRVGVRGVEKVISVEDKLFFAELECFVDLNPQQAGVHMSRFEEIVNEAIDEVVLGETLHAEKLAAHIAERVRERQRGMRAEVSVAARYPETVPTPASGLETQEIYTLLGTAVASDRGTRNLTGVEAHGMTACPCAQELVEGRSRDRLADDGFTDDEIERVFAAVPVATHNQRGIGSLRLGRPEGSELEVDARDLLHIVEQSMSSEIYELMKRSDEVAVVERAHLRPRFVEDCVREMIRRVVDAYPELGDGGFVLARQENLETIHRHSVVAERSGSLDEVARELETGEHSRHHMTTREWLEAPCA